MSESKIHDAQTILAMDKELKAKNFSLAGYGDPSSEESLQKTQGALEGLGYKVDVVDTAEDALAALQKIIPDGSSLWTTGSVTLEQIGFIDYLKNNSKYNNLKAKYLEATYVKKDAAAAAAFYREALVGQFWITSCSAITEAGELLSADATGTRVGGLTSSQCPIIVAGTNKIVADFAEAEKRLVEYQYELESARVREVYKAPSSTMSRVVSIKTGGFQPAPLRFVLIRGSFGY